MFLSLFLCFCVSENYLQFLQSYYKMSISKVTWFVLIEKNMRFGSPLDLLGPWGKTKPNYFHQNSLYCFITSQVAVGSQAVLCVSTPRIYPRSGYFLQGRRSWVGRVSTCPPTFFLDIYYKGTFAHTLSTTSRITFGL